MGVEMMDGKRAAARLGLRVGQVRRLVDQGQRKGERRSRGTVHGQRWSLRSRVPRTRLGRAKRQRRSGAWSRGGRVPRTARGRTALGKGASRPAPSTGDETMQETRMSDLQPAAYLVAHGQRSVLRRFRSRERADVLRRVPAPEGPDPADARRRSRMGGKSMKRHHGFKEPMLKEHWQ
jgi:hypothetical protein